MMTPMIDPNEIGKAIKELREEVGLTQQQLSHALYSKNGKGITITALSNIENGYSKPQYETIANLYNAIEDFKNQKEDQKNLKNLATERSNNNE